LCGARFSGKLIGCPRGYASLAIRYSAKFSEPIPTTGCARNISQAALSKLRRNENPPASAHLIATAPRNSGTIRERRNAPRTNPNRAFRPNEINGRRSEGELRIRAVKIRKRANIDPLESEASVSSVRIYKTSLTLQLLSMKGSTRLATTNAS
jgi:hypothetical protein